MQQGQSLILYSFCSLYLSFVCRGYIAPEILRADEFRFLVCFVLFYFIFFLISFSFPADMYSLGIVAFLLLSGGSCYNFLSS
jgi:serine/threonine protein kinase